MDTRVLVLVVYTLHNVTTLFSLVVIRAGALGFDFARNPRGLCLAGFKVGPACVESCGVEVLIK